MNPLPIVLATLRGHRLTCGLFVVLVACAVALGIAVTAQERALRQGSARAADAFDLVVAAPGSQTDVLLAAVYLRPTAMELVPGDVLARLVAEPRAKLVAPLAFGDSVRGAPVVGTTAAFVEHLSKGLAEGRIFATRGEAIAGATAPVAIGERLTPSHGMHASADGAAPHERPPQDDHATDDHGAGGHDDPAGADHARNDDAHDHDAHVDDAHGDEAHDHGAHDDTPAAPREPTLRAFVEGHVHGQAFTIVGRMKPTGTPWDRAVVVPVEYTWAVHGLPDGHAEGDDRIGPPFAAERLPGVPAVIVAPDSVAAAYGLRNTYRTAETTAFFPAEALVELYAVLGDVGRVMGLLTLATQSLVVAATVVGVLALLELYRRRFALLRALGAPRSFVFLTVWTFVTSLVASGAVLGLALGWGVSAAVSAALTRATGIAMPVGLGLGEVWLAAAIVAVGAALALLPAAIAYRGSAVAALRQG